MTPRWPVVVFDLDGTVIDTIPLIVQSYQYAIRTILDREVTDDEVRAWIGRPLLENCRAIAGDRAAEVFACYNSWHLSHLDTLLERHEGIDDLLRDLHSARVGIGISTNRRREPAMASLRMAGLAGTVPLLTTLEDTPLPKPHPSALQHTFTQLGADPHRSVYIGDAVVDIRAARAVGTQVIAVTWGSGLRSQLAEEHPDFLIDSLADLSGLLLPH